MTDTLEVVGASRHYGALLAVDGVSLIVRPGGVTGLIGPNGAGKSTLINLISGFAKVTSGKILVGDVDVTEMPPYAIARLGVARTFQTVRLYREMTVSENVEAGLRLGWWLTGRTASERAEGDGKGSWIGRWWRRVPMGGGWRNRSSLESVLRAFDLWELRDQMATTLPYGTQRRAEIARAVALEPSVLLLDEPAAGMTDGESEELGQRIRSIASGGVAVLLIEHNTRLVSRVCQYVYVMVEGHVLAEGSARSVMANADVVSAYLGEK